MNIQMNEPHGISIYDTLYHHLFSILFTLQHLKGDEFCHFPFFKFNLLHHMCEIINDICNYKWTYK